MSVPSLLPLTPLLQSLLSQPTAPFHEDAVASEIARLLAACPHVTMEADSLGNLIATYRRGTPDVPLWAFAAHMDHPGWVRHEGEWKFLGGVPKAYLDTEAPRQLFGEGGDAVANFAMWDLPAFELGGPGGALVYSRACDDLVGCAAIVAMFQNLEAQGAECVCVGLFTRAEEVGFVGAVALAQSGLLPESLTILSLETSAERPPAKMGDGVIIRVGDRTSLFDPAVTAELVATATEMQIPFQRALMQGGTCEATAYSLYGYRCGALCVALGNYHNCGPETTIAPEYVSLSDTEGLVALCTALAQRRPSGKPDSALKERLENLQAEYRSYVRPLGQPVVRPLA